MKRILFIIIATTLTTLWAQPKASMRFGIAFDPMFADSIFTATDSIDQLLVMGKILPRSAVKDSVTVRDSLIMDFAVREKALVYPIDFSFKSDPTRMIRCGNIPGMDKLDTFRLDDATIRVFSLYSPDTIVKHPIYKPNRFDYNLVKLVDEAFSGKDSTDFDILVTNLPKHVIKRLFPKPPCDLILSFDYVPTRNETLFDDATRFYSLATNPKAILHIKREQGKTDVIWQRK